MVSMDLIISRSLTCSVVCNGVVMDNFTLIFYFVELTWSMRKLINDVYINVLHLVQLLRNSSSGNQLFIFCG